MRTRASVAVAALILPVLAPVATAAAPLPAYEPAGTVEVAQEELDQRGRLRSVVDGDTLYIGREHDVLAIDLSTQARTVIGTGIVDESHDIYDIDARGGVLWLSAVASGFEPSYLHAFDSAGKHLRTISLGAQPGWPRVAVAPDGTVYTIAQRSGKSLHWFAPDGSSGSALTHSCGSTISPDKLCDTIMDLAVTEDHVLVADHYLKVVRILDREGNHLGFFEEIDDARDGLAISAREVSVDAQGLVYLERFAAPSGFEVHRVVPAAEGGLTLERLARVSSTELGSTASAPSLLADGTLLILVPAPWRSEDIGYAQLFKPIPAAWVDPQVTGSPAVGRTLSADPGVWPTGWSSLRYQWLRDGSPLPGATGAQREVSPEDAGHRLSVQVTATYAQGRSASASSSEVTVPAPPKPQVTVRLAKSSLPRSSRAKVTVKVSSTAAPVGKIVVRAGGKKLASATLKASHRGSRTLTLPYLKVGTHKVTASLEAGGAIVASKAAPLRVTKGKAKVTATLAKKKVSQGSRARLTVRVKVKGLAKPTGKLVIRDGKKKLRTVTLKAKHRGKISVRLPRLAPGKHAITVSYGGSSQVKKKNAKKLVLRVVR